MNTNEQIKGKTTETKKVFLFNNNWTTYAIDIRQMAHVHDWSNITSQYWKVISQSRDEVSYFLGLVNFDGKISPVVDLPILLWTKSIQEKLSEMKNTKQAHVNFFQKLEKIVNTQIAKLNGQPHENLDFDLQLDHTQCAFWKALFWYLKSFQKNLSVKKYLESFIQPHKNFHSKVADIKEHFNDPEKIKEIFEDIKTNDYPTLLKLFDSFDGYINSEIKKTKYIFIRLYNNKNINYIPQDAQEEEILKNDLKFCGIKVDDMAWIDTLEFEEEDQAWLWTISVAKRNSINWEKIPNWEEEIIIDLLQIEKVKTALELMQNLKEQPKEIIAA